MHIFTDSKSPRYSLGWCSCMYRVTARTSTWARGIRARSTALSRSTRAPVRYRQICSIPPLRLLCVRLLTTRMLVVVGVLGGLGARCATHTASARFEPGTAGSRAAGRQDRLVRSFVRKPVRGGGIEPHPPGAARDSLLGRLGSPLCVCARLFALCESVLVGGGFVYMLVREQIHVRSDIDIHLLVAIC